MPCYRPNVSWVTYGSPNQFGEVSESWHFKNLQNIDRTFDGSSIDSWFKSFPEGTAFWIPCKHCLGCKLDKSREWADRMFLELDHSKKAIFVTLTYSDTWLPISRLNFGNGDYEDLFDPWAPAHSKSAHPVRWPVAFYKLNGRFPEEGEKYDYLDNSFSNSVCIRDGVNFIKDLRYAIQPATIRNYTSYEYGGRTGRSHLHLIIFGLSLDDLAERGKLIYRSTDDLCHKLYSSEFLEDIWSYGNVRVSDVSWRTCAYVSRYVMKKLYGPQAKFYIENHLREPFATMSRMPGIGHYYPLDHPDVYDSSSISCSDIFGDGQMSVAIPKSFIRILRSTNPSLYATLVKERSQYASDAYFSTLLKSDLSYIEQLAVLENDRISRTKVLTKRDKTDSFS